MNVQTTDLTPQTDDIAGQKAAHDLPPLRSPVIFYGCVVAAFGFLGAAVLALIL